MPSNQDVPQPFLSGQTGVAHKEWVISLTLIVEFYLS